MEPTITMFDVAETDNRAVFALIDRSGEELLLIPTSEFEIAGTTEFTIILKRKKITTPS